MVEELVCFGLTRQEATIYNTLLSEGVVTGYEAAKLTGISRSNTYNALAGLVEKGAAYIMEGSATKYVPVELEFFCDNKLRAMNEVKNRILAQAPKQKEFSEGYITVKGRRHIVDKMKNMLEKAEERVYIAVSEKILEYIEVEIKSLIERRLKLVIITNKAYIAGVSEWASDQFILYESDISFGQIRLIVDSRSVLTGDLGDEETSACLYSGNKNLADVFKEMLKNEIILIEQKLKADEQLYSNSI